MDSVVTLAIRHRRELIALDRAAAARLVSAYAGIWTVIKGELAGLTAEIAAYRADGEEVPPGRLFRLARYRDLLAAAEEQLMRWETIASGVATGAQERALLRVAGDQLQMLGASLGQQVGISFSTMPHQAIAAMVGFAGDGTPLAALIRAANAEALVAARRVLVTGIATGRPIASIEREFRRAMGIPLSRSLAITRTETLRAYREAARVGVEENAEFLEGWTWYAARDGRTCFPAGVVVSGPKPHASSARHYTGELVVLSIAGREDLSVTPNHPILTPQGWVAAGNLMQGDYVLGSADAEQTASHVDEHDDQMPAPIEEVAQSVSVVAVEMPTAAPDFHGDGVGSDVHVVRSDCQLGDGGQSTLLEPSAQDYLGFGHAHGLPFGSDPFEHLGSLGSLFDGNDLVGLSVAVGSAALAQRTCLSHESLSRLQVAPPSTGISKTGADRCPANAVGLSERVLGLAGQVTASDLLVGQAHSPMLSAGHLDAAEGIRDDLVAEESASLQVAGEPFGVYSEARAHALSTLAGDIRADRVLKVARRGFSGHVYNLETGPHWYLANGIIVANCAVCWSMHGTFFPLTGGSGGGMRRVAEVMATHVNCRCVLVPRAKSYAEITGDTTLPDNRPQITPGPTLFARQTPERQVAILGPGKFARYRAGQLHLGDLVELVNDPRWGPTRREVPLNRLQRHTSLAETA